ncbi:MAG: sulfotransferase family protein [Gemmatimonadota bacterium]
MTPGDGFIAIGGSSGSGTTLLAAVLGRHPRLYCGPELSCLDKAELYERPWPAYRRRFRRDPQARLEIEDVRWRRPMFDGLAETPVARPELAALAAAATNYADYVRAFETLLTRRTNRARWVEKTPTNVFCAGRLLEAFPDARFVHLVRDGRDSLVSQLRRGRSLHHAAWIWLCAAAAGVRLRDHPRVLTLRYEEMTAKPEATLRGICDWLGEAFEGSILSGTGGGGTVHDSWTSSPAEPINQRSVARYLSELDRQTEELFYSFRLTDVGREMYEAPFASVPEALEYWGYEPKRSSWPDATLEYRLKARAPSALKRIELRLRGKQVADHAPQSLIRWAGSPED